VKKFILSGIVGFVSLFSCQEAQIGTENASELNSRFAEFENMFRPGLGSFMNQIQVYHVKLSLAVSENNNELVSYLIHELEEQFEKVVIVHKTHDGIALNEIADQTIFPALHDLEQANERKDSLSLVQSFESLTVSCNKCHVSTGHSFIRIKRPEANPFLNQDFTVQ